MGNYLVSMLKGDPVLSVVSIVDMLNLANLIGDRTFRYLVFPLSMVGPQFSRGATSLLGAPYACSVHTSKTGSLSNDRNYAFRDNQALPDADSAGSFQFSVKSGEGHTLIGPSGSREIDSSPLSS